MFCLCAACRFLLLLVACNKNKETTLFESLPASATHIDFANNLKPEFDFNILDYNYFYNGGGIAAADFNNDGLTDLYFTGNQVSSKLYLNKGNFVFEDVTEKAGVATANWATGVAVADVNDDGLQDMYVSYAGINDPQKRTHQFFINQGITKESIAIFEDKAAAYGLADTSYTTQSVFFDYDKDGDLDLLSVNHYQDKTNPNNPKVKGKDGSSSSNAKLYKNTGGSFSEVSGQAGILDEGYGLGVCISDLNGDSWPDIYIAKDFVYDDALYINNRNGTFTESITAYLRHTSQFSMGCDVADFNNDSYPDIVTVDMLPNDNKRQKLMNIAMNNDRFNYALSLGYLPQYARNMLQLNNGPDASGAYSFSEVGQLAGVYKTDWSWSPLFADFDNDGWKDLYITNGIPKDITNNDFISYRATQIVGATETDFKVLKNKMLAEIDKLEPVDKPNFVFQNNKDLFFTNQSANWGLAQEGFSNGAVYVDLDNDGDLDLVTNNINATASVYKNQSEKISQNRFIRIKLDGRFAVGAKISVDCNGSKQYLEHNSVRGFQSSQDPVRHFGLGKNTTIDTLKVVWLDGKEQVLVNVAANQTITVAYKDAVMPVPKVNENVSVQRATFFSDITATAGIEFLHRQYSFEDFNHEPLLPHRFSKNGPYLATGDVDGNGLEDVWIGGPAKVPGKLLLQQANGKLIGINMPDSGYEDMGGVLFDADGDKDLDLYVVSGGNVYNPLTATYQDRLYGNDGKGNFTLNKGALPTDFSSGSVVAANDFDKDGDLDLVVGGRVIPTRYPVLPESYVLRNTGRGLFENATASICPDLKNIGMITSALWSDFDGDGWTDLIVAGEWMPVIFFKNDHGVLKKLQGHSLDGAKGWWFSLAAGDFDKDGDTDYIAGNLGLNNRYDATEKTPVSVYAKDFDGNGTIEPILTYYVNGTEYSIPNRDQITSVMPSIKKKFDTYTKFSEAEFATLFSKEELQDALVLQATTFASVYIENGGNGKFTTHTLPVLAQVSAIQDMEVGDFNLRWSFRCVDCRQFLQSRFYDRPVRCLHRAFINRRWQGKLYTGFSCAKRHTY
jgi:hypothetical protein